MSAILATNVRGLCNDRALRSLPKGKQTGALWS